MITMKLDQAKHMFFDRDVVIGAMDKATHAALSRGGAIVMRTARKSIKNGWTRARGRTKSGERRATTSRVSAPGGPPFSQTGLLRDNILFISTPGTLGGSNVKIGPVLINRPTGAPDNLEFGGGAELPARTVRVRGRRKADGSFRPDRTKQIPARSVRIQARPYMRPALEKLVESRKLPDMWRNALVGGT